MPSYVDSLETIEVDSLPTMLAAAALQILKSEIGVKREVQCRIFEILIKYNTLLNYSRTNLSSHKQRVYQNQNPNTIM